MAAHRSQRTNNPDPEKSAQTLENLSEAYRKLSPYLNIGVVWALSVLFFTWVGTELDARWNTRPWLTVTGAVLGIFSGFYHFLKTVTARDQAPDDRKSDRNS